MSGHTPGSWTVDAETGWISAGPLTLPANAADSQLMASAPELLTALEEPMTCEICTHQPEDRNKAILAAAGRIRSALRTTRTGGKGGGRPLSAKCACGAMTVYQALKTGHTCLYEEGTPCPRQI